MIYKQGTKCLPVANGETGYPTLDRFQLNFLLSYICINYIKHNIVQPLLQNIDVISTDGLFRFLSSVVNGSGINS